MWGELTQFQYPSVTPYRFINLVSIPIISLVNNQVLNKKVCTIVTL